MAGTKQLALRLFDEGNKFRTYTTIFTILTALGAAGIGYTAAQDVSCQFFTSVPSCSTETDGPTFLIVGLSTFVAGMLLVLPLRAAAQLLVGVAVILDNQVADIDE